MFNWIPCKLYGIIQSIKNMKSTRPTRWSTSVIVVRREENFTWFATMCESSFLVAKLPFFRDLDLVFLINIPKWALICEVGLKLSLISLTTMCHDKIFYIIVSIYLSSHGSHNIKKNYHIFSCYFCPWIVMIYN